MKGIATSTISKNARFSHVTDGTRDKTKHNFSRVHFNLNNNETIDVPRVDPADKARLYYRRVEFKFMVRCEHGLFHTYQFYQKMHSLEMNAKRKEALLRKMKRISKEIVGIRTTRIDAISEKERTKQPRKLPDFQECLKSLFVHVSCSNSLNDEPHGANYESVSIKCFSGALRSSPLNKIFAGLGLLVLLVVGMNTGAQVQCIRTTLLDP